jgi:hypothetical protein
MILNILHPRLPKYSSAIVSSGSAVLHNKAKHAIGPPIGKEWVVTFKASDNKKDSGDVHILMSGSNAAVYNAWLDRVVKFMVACEKGEFVFRTTDWAFDLTGINTREYRIKAADPAFKGMPNQVMLYRQGTFTLQLNPGEETDRFSALLNKYIQAVANINEGVFHLFEIEEHV